jgi:4'-phosphopantetheinyl transferase
VSLIHLLYTSFDSPLEEQLYLNYLNILPVSFQEKNSRYIRWQDRHAHLFGKLLTLKGLQLLKYNDTILNSIQYNQYDRPFLNNHVDFNISHSGQYVVCAIAKDIKLGIDIEEVKKIEFEDFKEVMTDEQWKCITNSDNSYKEFFEYWAIKESVIKADSRGLSIPLTNIHVNGNIVTCEGELWYIKKIEMDENYCCYLACNKQHIKINTQRIDFFGQ